MKLKVRGKKHIEGEVKISGAKNSAVAVIPAAILTDEEITLYNIPNISDVNIQINILKSHGFQTIFNNNTLIINKKKTRRKINTTLENDTNLLRGSSYFIGAFLGKYKKIKMNAIGGCNIGPRPINYHIESFKKMNVKYKQSLDFQTLKTKKLKGAEINLSFPSVGATINILIASALAKGITKINNAALEPEVIDVGNFLIAMGAQIKGLGTPNIEITGVKKLHGCSYRIISDRIEAGTFLAIGALSDGDGVTVSNIEPLHLISVTNALSQMGHKLDIYSDTIVIKKGENLKSINIETAPFPGFPTDLNPIFSVLLTQLPGNSSIKETIFSDRTSHISELKNMGANITYKNNLTQIEGPTDLKYNNLVAKDLRCAACLLIAALLSRCTTTIDNIEYLLRGYEDIIYKLKCLNINAKID